jgi:hypothetical protein
MNNRQRRRAAASRARRYIRSLNAYELEKLELFVRRLAAADLFVRGASTDNIALRLRRETTGRDVECHLREALSAQRRVRRA